MVFLCSFLLTSLSLIASESSINSSDSRIAQRISSDVIKHQSDLAVVESSLLAIEQDEVAAYNSLQLLYQQAVSELVHPASLAYATNLLDRYKHIRNCGIAAELIVSADRLQEHLDVLEKGGLSVNNFFYRNLTDSEMHAYQELHTICSDYKNNVHQMTTDSIQAIHIQLQQMSYRKLNVQQHKFSLLQSLQVYNKIMTDIECDRLVSISDASSSLYSECDDSFVDKSQAVVNKRAATVIQALYRMSRAKQIPQVVAMHQHQDICKNIAKPLVYELLNGVDMLIDKKNQEKKEAYDILCRQVQAANNRKNIETTVVDPVLQSILDKTFGLVDQRQADRLLQAQTSELKASKKKKKINSSKDQLKVQSDKNEADEALNLVVAQNKAQEEFQNIWITNIDMKLTELINNYKVADSEIKSEGLASIIVSAIEQLEIVGLDSTRVAASFVKASISMNVNLAKLHLDENAKIAWLQDHYKKNFSFIMNNFDPDKKKCNEYQIFHLSTLFSYLISFVHNSLEVNLK